MSSVFFNKKFFGNTGYINDRNYPILSRTNPKIKNDLENLDERTTVLEGSQQSGNIGIEVNSTSVVEMDTSFNVMLVRNTTGAPITITLDTTNTLDLLEYKIVAISDGDPNLIIFETDIKTYLSVATTTTFDNTGTMTLLFSDADNLFFLLNATGGNLLP
jgi:hypothetical protein